MERRVNYNFMYKFNVLNFTYLSYRSLYTIRDIKSLILFRIIDPLLHYMFFSILAISIIGTDYINFIIIGNIMFITAQTMIVNLLTMFRYEKLYGTIELNVVTPTAFIKIILRKSIIPIIDSLFIFIISIFLIAIFFNINLPIINLPYLALTIAVSLFSLLGVSLIIAALGLLFSNVNLFLNLILSIFQIFCGVNFPTSYLPNFMEKISAVIPTTNAIQAIRLIYTNNNSNEVFNLLTKELFIGLIFFLFSIFLIHIMKYFALKKGAFFKDF